MNGWGNSYDIKPNKKTAPLDLDVNYAMRCEYPDLVAAQCLCPENPCQKVVHESVAQEYPCMFFQNQIGGENGGSTAILALNIARS